jgi:hypothetical protein
MSPFGGDSLEEAQRYIDWCQGENREAQRKYAAKEEAEHSGNMFQLRLECHEHTEYQIVQRQVTEWEKVPT